MDRWITDDGEGRRVADELPKSSQRFGRVGRHERAGGELTKKSIVRRPLQAKGKSCVSGGGLME